MYCHWTGGSSHGSVCTGDTNNSVAMVTKGGVKKNIACSPDSWNKKLNIKIIF